MISATFPQVTSGSEYARRFACQALGVPVAAALDQDQLDRIFFELSRSEEIRDGSRDKWGNWEWLFQLAGRDGRIFKPWLDLELIGSRKPSPAWPDGKAFALCLTHDVDYVFARKPANASLREMFQAIEMRAGAREIAKRFKNACRSLIGRGIGRRPTALWRADDWMKLEDSHGFRSTFFFFPSDVGRRHQWDCTYSLSDRFNNGTSRIRIGDVMRELDRAGWNIGLHGSYLSAVEPGLLERQKQDLERWLDHTIIATRQHYLHYDAARTPRLQADAGIRVDSTLGFNLSVGFRAGTSFPHFAWDHESRQMLPLVEVPQTVMDVSLFRNDALEYDEQQATVHCLELLAQVERVGGVLTLNWHANVERGGKEWRVYETILAEAARRNPWNCTMDQLYSHWMNRDAEIGQMRSSGVSQ